MGKLAAYWYIIPYIGGASKIYAMKNAHKNRATLGAGGSIVKDSF